MQALAMEIYKHILGLSPTIKGEVFQTNRTLPSNLSGHTKCFPADFLKR